LAHPVAIRNGPLEVFKKSILAELERLAGKGEITVLMPYIEEQRRVF
jgi:hypothetical protein